MIESIKDQSAEQVKLDRARLRKLLYFLADYPLVVAFLAARVNRPHSDPDLEQAVAAAILASRGIGAGLGKGKLHPEAAKQLDHADANAVQNEQGEDRKNTGKVDPDELDDGGEEEAAHQAADQPGEAQVKLSFVPVTEFEQLHDLMGYDVKPVTNYIPVAAKMPAKIKPAPVFQLSF